MPAALADQQHELPARVTVLADAVRLRDLGERESLRDREREAPGLGQLAEIAEAHRVSEDGHARGKLVLLVG